METERENERLGEKLYRLRTSRGISQEELAEELGVSRQTISNWENDKVKLDAEKAAQLCAYYGVSMDSLFMQGRSGRPMSEAGRSNSQKTSETPPEVIPEKDPAREGEKRPSPNAPSQSKAKWKKALLIAGIALFFAVFCAAVLLSIFVPGGESLSSVILFSPRFGFIALACASVGVVFALAWALIKSFWK